MNTDRKPTRGESREEYEASTRLTKVRLPPSETLTPLFCMLEAARNAGSRKELSQAAQQLIEAFSSFYAVASPDARLLGVRPHRTLEGLLASELFGDYNIDLARIRLWTRTSIQKQWTSSRTLLSTLCHEFMHHLDVTRLGFPRSYHTTGFFERTHCLYLAVLGQPHYSLAWHPPERNGRHSIDWPETNRRRAMAAPRREAE